MSRGYLITVQGNYVAQAELLARSIKKTQSEVTSISVITDQDIKSPLFEHVIPLPDYALQTDSKWKIHNRVFNYDLSPYDETVMLDADMVFLTDVSHWWKHLAKHELLITDKVKTFRDEWVNESQNPYRQCFIANQLPNMYSAFAYFKKTPKAKEFFDLLKVIVANWDEWSTAYAANQRQTWASLDLAMAIAAKVLDYQDITAPVSYPYFTHMKGRCQGYATISDRWSDVLGYNIGEDYLRIGAHVQTGILHYYEKDFVHGDIQELF